VLLPKLAPPFFARYGDRVIEPEIKLVFAALFLLMWLGSRANSQAALPAFVLGLAMSSFYVSYRAEQNRMRVVSFAFLTPFFFLKGGLNVSLGAVFANLGILIATLLSFAAILILLFTVGQPNTAVSAPIYLAVVLAGLLVGIAVGLRRRPAKAARS